MASISDLIKPEQRNKGKTLKIYVFERGVDLVTPLVHDFYYENILEDFINLEI